MSTAEQIIAEHQLDIFDGTCTCRGWDYSTLPDDPNDPDLAKLHAAHVVAALTNAGKAIVELPESADCRIGELVLDEDGGTILVRTSAKLVQTLTLGEWRSAVGRRVLADALLQGAAAARVAEGGDQP